MSKHFVPAPAIALALILAVTNYAIATDAGAIVRSGSMSDAPKPIKTVTLSSPADVHIRSFPGYLKAKAEVNLSFRVPGQLIELPALKGTLMKQGDLLARLDPRDYQNRVSESAGIVENLAEILQSLEQARPEDITSAEAAVNAAKATAENDKINLERYRNLYSQGVVPKSQLDSMQAQSDVSANALKQAQQSLEKAMTGARPEDIKAAQANLDAAKAHLQTVTDALDDTRLCAPFTGIVSDRMVDNHQNVLAGQPVLSMQDLKTFEVVVNVPEQILILYPKRILLDHVTAEARFDVIPGKTFPLAFKEFSTRVDQMAQTFAATFYLTPEDERYTFLPGMTVTVDVKFDLGRPEERTDFILPPQAVVMPADGDRYVWRLAKTDRDGVFKTEKVRVKIGDFAGDGVLVTSGVKSGESFASAGAAYLEEGMLVTPLEWEGKR